MPMLTIPLSQVPTVLLSVTLAISVTPVCDRGHDNTGSFRQRAPGNQHQDQWHEHMSLGRCKQPCTELASSCLSVTVTFLAAVFAYHCLLSEPAPQCQYSDNAFHSCPLGTSSVTVILPCKGLICFWHPEKGSSVSGTLKRAHLFLAP